MKTHKQIKALEKQLGLKPGKCGSGYSEWVVPDAPPWMWFKSIRWACREHDIAYEIGGTEVDRVKADGNFCFDILQIYRSSWFWNFLTYRLRARATAEAYYNAVRKWGKDKFNHTINLKED